MSTNAHKDGAKMARKARKAERRRTAYTMADGHVLTHRERQYYQGVCTARGAHHYERHVTFAMCYKHIGSDVPRPRDQKAPSVSHDFSELGAGTLELDTTPIVELTPRQIAARKAAATRKANKVKADG